MTIAAIAIAIFLVLLVILATSLGTIHAIQADFTASVGLEVEETPTIFALYALLERAVGLVIFAHRAHRITLLCFLVKSDEMATFVEVLTDLVFAMTAVFCLVFDIIIVDVLVSVSKATLRISFRLMELALV